jgi:hypothetical protein
MKKLIGGFLALLFLTSCASDPMLEIRAKLKSKDFTAAKSLMEAAIQKVPEKPEPHYGLFILYQYLMVNGDPEAIKGAVREYEWIAKAENLNIDYTNMEASIRQGAKSRIFYKEAREAMYGPE